MSLWGKRFNAAITAHFHWGLSPNDARCEGKMPSRQPAGRRRYKELLNGRTENSGAGTAIVDPPGENTVQVTFLPEGKTVQFEHGKLPYKDHGKQNHCWTWR